MGNELINQLFIWQVVLPLGVILINALVPVATGAGALLRTTIILGLLAYTALSGIWLFPPWWTPFVFVVFQLLITWRQVRHVKARGRVGSVWQISETSLSLAGIAGVAFLTLPALQGRTPPDVVIDLAMPLGPGRYLVISGGATPQINSHFFTLDLPRAAPFRGQSHGIDVIGIDAFGFRTSGISPADPTLYKIYEADVLAPCNGTVIAVTDGVPDNVVPDMNRDAMTGNSVVLECDGLAVVLAHFIPGSLSVTEGETVEIGQGIANVGNSGNSGEPHLHVHVQEIASRDQPISGEPLWFTIEGRFLVRNTRFMGRQ
ncbi:M23 family peptidase [Rhodobacteraceae bacterium 63075]|nr:M23 family peptidase [Rhodobacteraceae bacterium 63075]